MSGLSERLIELSPAKRALLEARLKNARDVTLPIAIVGLACRFPGAENAEAFWRLLHDGVDAVSEVPPDRWNVDDFYDPAPATPGKMNNRCGGFLEQVDKFDARFFGISPREAVSIDPQQRLLLEVTWEALEDAGQAPEKLAGSETGVFIGISSNDYSFLQFQTENRYDPYLNTGNALSIAANRLSYHFDLRGPSLAVDTACSSSLVAVHLACQSLWSGESDLALAGGVNLILSPDTTIALSQARMMAADGRCKTFDAAADGYVRGEGCGIVILKPLLAALSDNNQILALIRGSAINQDGRSNGITAPNGPAQQAVVRRALKHAKVTPAQISYVETHGTGTPLGDPIEIQALATLLGARREPDNPCAIGAVKTNFGHLEAAAGIASLIKVVLCLQHGEIAPNLHLKTLNPHIKSKEIPLFFPTECRPWTSNTERRFAGVSSFGFGGTNAHVVLEEAPAPRVADSQVERPLHILTLSAQNENALKELAHRYSKHLITHPEERLQDVCFTANSGRSHFSNRLAAIAASSMQLSNQLRAFAAGEQPAQVWSSSAQNRKRAKVAFLFTGQGSQYAGMGQQLYDTHAGFRRTLDCCEEALRDYLDEPLLSVMFAEPGSELAAKLDETIYTQPALFALEYALAQLWREWGIEPTYALGHSIGEYVAACVAGVFRLEDGLRLVAERARMMHAMPRDGVMAAVFAREEQVAEVIAPLAAQVSLAAINGPRNVVISGVEKAVNDALETLRAAGVPWRQLNVSHAFHSPLMEPMLPDFERVAGAVEYHAARIRVVSNVTGQVAKEKEIESAAYWAKHLRATVRFAPGIETLNREGCNIYVEVGPHPTLTAIGRRCKSDDRDALWIGTLCKNRNDWEQMLESAGRLYVSGAEVAWDEVDRPYDCRKVSLPTYPFQRESYWAGVRPGDKMTRRTPEGDLLVAEGDGLRPAREACKTLVDPIDRNAQDLVLERLYEVEWVPELRDIYHSGTGAELAGQHRTWLVFADRRGIGAALAQRLNSHGDNAVIVSAGETFGVADDGRYYINPSHSADFQKLLWDACAKLQSLSIIYLWNLDIPAPEETTSVYSAAARVFGCDGVLLLVQALIKNGMKASPRLWIVTRGAEVVGLETTQAAVTQSPVWGLGRVIALEHPEVWGGLIDLSPDENTGVGNEQKLAAQLEEFLLSQGEDQIAFRLGKRYVPRLVRSRKRETQPLKFHPEGTYLITGGLGALGLTLARWMVLQGVRRLVLVSRTGVPDRTSWEDLPRDTSAMTRHRVAAMQTLEQLGATVSVVQADSSEPAGMAEVFKELTDAHQELKGVVHAAGLLKPMTLEELTRETLEAVMLPKVQGAWILHQLTKELNLDFFITLSSVASVWGGLGLAHYAAANHFLDALAHYRHALGLPASTINWGPWGEVGVESAIFAAGYQSWRQQKGIVDHENSDPHEEYQKVLAEMGLYPLQAEQSLQALEYILQAGITQATVCQVDWAKFRPIYEARAKRSFLNLIETEATGETGQQLQTAAELRNAKAELSGERLETIEAYLRGSLARVLRLNEEEIDVERNILELGVDSLMIMEVINELKRDFQINLYPREFFERPSIRAMATHIQAELDGGQFNKTSALPLPAFYSSDLARSTISERQNRQRPAQRRRDMIFLLSSPRSGSTLLRVMLAGHPALFCPPELHLLPFADMRERCEALGPTHLSEGLERALMELQLLRVEESKALIENLTERAVSIADVYAMLQQQAGARLLVDKSPTYAWSLEILMRAEELFDAPKYIHLTRHPYAVIESFVRMRMDKFAGIANVDPFESAEHVWTTTNRNVRDFLKPIASDRQHLVRFEELVDNPLKEAKELCAFLGVSFDEALLRPYEGQRMTDGLYPQSMGIGDPNFLDHAEIDPALGQVWRRIKLPRLLGRSAQALATELNYELPQESSIASVVTTQMNISDKFEEGRL